MTLDYPNEAQDLLDRLMAWSLPEGMAEALARLDTLAAEVDVLCGPAPLPADPNLRREALMDRVEDFLETDSLGRREGSS